MPPGGPGSSAGPRSRRIRATHGHCGAGAGSAKEGRHVADSVLYQVDGAVATITINRPAARNALTSETKMALLEALRTASGDDADPRCRDHRRGPCILLGPGPA